MEVSEPKWNRDEKINARESEELQMYCKAVMAFIHRTKEEISHFKNPISIYEPLSCLSANG